MSVVASSRPESTAVPYYTYNDHHHGGSHHGGQPPQASPQASPQKPPQKPPQPARYRRSSNSPYYSFRRPSSSTTSLNTNCSTASAPASYSHFPPSPISPFAAPHLLPFSSTSSLPHIADSSLRRLPQHVYDIILGHLEYLHTGPRKSGCLTCFQRDLHALSLTCRTWEKAVRAKLYNRIHIIGNDSPAQLKKYRMKRGSRLKLLRRTLRERKLLANLVLELRVPQMDSFMAKSAQWEEYRDLVASVVMVCPNLERLLGLSIPYNHEFDRLTYALSKRKNLKEHVWILGEAPEVPEGSPRSSSCPGSLGPLQMFEFLNYHVAWTNLNTLMLYAASERSALEPSIFLRMFSLLPSLRNLCISSFNANAFDDNTLVCLPALESLRLENLPGVTDAGLSQYSSCAEAKSLKSLAIVEQNVGSLLVLSRLLTSLAQLERFTIVQTSRCPTLPEGEMVFQPLLASSSLKHLHWDVSSPQSAISLSKFDPSTFRKSQPHSDSPNSHLARSILAAGFPNLRTLRAPSDIEPLGALQAVCQPAPNGQALVPSDRYSLPRSSHGSVNARRSALPAGNNLTSARIRAQTLIEMANKDTESGVRFVITDYSDSYVPDNVSEDASSFEEEDEEGDVDEFGVITQRDSSTTTNNNNINNDNNNDNSNNDDDDQPHEETTEGPVDLHEFRVPAYMGRVGIHDSLQNASIPRFILQPDIPGFDADGGLIGWRHLLSSNQCYSYAAGVGTNCFFANRSNTNTNLSSSSSALEEPPLSPLSTTPNPAPTFPTTTTTTTPSSSTSSSSFSSSRFTWGHIGNRSTILGGGGGGPSSSPSPSSSSTSATSLSSSSMSHVLPAWEKDTCTGAWNVRHRNGKDWWFHVERDRPRSVELISVKHFF